MNVSPEFLGAAALVLTAVSGLVVGFRNSGSGKTSASAAELTSVGARLDEANERIDKLEDAMKISRLRESALIDHGYELRRLLAASGVEVPDWPAGLP